MILGRECITFDRMFWEEPYEKVTFYLRESCMKEGNKPCGHQGESSPGGQHGSAKAPRQNRAWCLGESWWLVWLGQRDEEVSSRRIYSPGTWQRTEGLLRSVVRVGQA